MSSSNNDDGENKKNTEGPIVNLILPPPSSSSSILVPKKWEFLQPPSGSGGGGGSLLGADLGGGMGNTNPPPKLNKSRVLVNPGKSMVEWMRIQGTISAPPPSKRIGSDELSTHNTLGDVWMGINDKVYDVSEYVEYHPGGVEELMKGAGMDGTALFNQVHRWVNYESILRKKCVGYLVGENTLVKKKDHQVTLPSTKFSEDEESVFLEIDSHLDEDNVKRESWTVGLLNRERLILRLTIKPPKVWMNQIQLLQTLTEDKFSIREEEGFRRMVLRFTKPKKHEQWKRLGLPLEVSKASSQLLDSRTCMTDLFFPSKIKREKQLTHNTFLFTVKTPSSLHLRVPLGWHLLLRLNKRIERPFTPVSLFLMEDNGMELQNNDNQDQELHFIIKLYSEGLFTSTLNKLTTPLLTYSSPLVDIEIGYPGGTFDPILLHSLDFLLLFAAGTGITPFIRILEYLSMRRNSLPVSRAVLIFFNESEQDIIHKDELMKLQSSSSWFTFVPVISRPAKEDTFPYTGRISVDLFDQIIKTENLIPSPDDSDKSTLKMRSLICGSHGFNAACKKTLMDQPLLPPLRDPSTIFIFSG